MNVVAIVNPAAGRGRAARAWIKVRSGLQCAAETFETKGRGHATELTALTIRRGASVIVAVGGDGTVNEVVNGFFQGDQLISNRAVLAIVPHGTGSDFIRTLRLARNDNAAALINSGKSRPVDLLQVRYSTPEGASTSRYSLNITSFGIGAAVASRVNRFSRRMGARLSFVLATLQTAATFPGKTVSIRFDDGEPIEERITNVAVGNGQYHGGGMRVCPRAEIDDGCLDATVIEFLPALQLVHNLPLLYNGCIYNHPKVRFLRAKRLRADSREDVPIEIDGEPSGRLPIDIRVAPHAIRVVAP